jgi:hypothetical protein
MLHPSLAWTAIALMLPLAVFGQSAPSEPVYRCGPDGTRYASTPCPEGHEVKVSDPRSAAQQREARAVAERDRQLAERLTAERVQREKATVPAMAGSLGPSASSPAAGTKSAKAKTPPPKKKKKKAEAKDQRAGSTSSRYLAQS